MKPSALIFWGGWDGHEPDKVAALFGRILKEEGFATQVVDSLGILRDVPFLDSLDLIVPVWTMGKVDAEQQKNVCSAIAGGVGLGGCHGGMCDAFREATEWQFMTGGQWVAHPGDDGLPYTVHITGEKSPITDGIADFQVRTEQYYMHIDPAIRILATTRFPIAPGPHTCNGAVDMPILWTKLYGQGRVFYNALGHHADVLEREPVLTLMRRGFRWAARKSDDRAR